jgi:hypothetical protein
LLTYKNSLAHSTTKSNDGTLQIKKRKRKWSLKTPQSNTRFLAEVTCHLLKGNIANKNPQGPRTCKSQNFRCHKNSLAHSATENNDRRLQMKNKKKKILPQNFMDTPPFSY